MSNIEINKNNSALLEVDDGIHIIAVEHGGMMYAGIASVVSPRSDTCLGTQAFTELDDAGELDDEEPELDNVEPEDNCLYVLRSPRPSSGVGELMWGYRWGDNFHAEIICYGARQLMEARGKHPDWEIVTSPTSDL